MGFGFASLLTSPIAQYLIQARGVEQTFYILGVVYFVVMLFVSQFIKRLPRYKRSVQRHVPESDIGQWD